MEKRSVISRTSISIGLVFHLMVIVLLPNEASSLRRDLMPILLPYSNLFGLNSKWQFFAPDPETANYLEYQIDWKDKPPEIGNETVFRFPQKNGFFDLLYTRRNSVRAYMILDRAYMTGIFIAWVCRDNPNAAGVSVRQAVVNLPSLSQVQNGQPLYDAANIHYGEAVTASCEEVLRGS